MRAILTFHSIDDQPSILSYSPSLFSFLLDTLKQKQIPILDIYQLLDDIERPGIAITFDDGMKSVHSNALPLLKQHEVPAHIFIATGAVQTEQLWPDEPDAPHQYAMLDWNEIKALHENGVYIESHTHSHPDLRTLAAAQIDQECQKSDEIIETHVNRKPQIFAYPYGYHNRICRETAGQRYRACVTTELKSLSKHNASAALPRLDSFYFQTPAMIKNIDSTLMKFYLMARNTLRNIKGSQCRADQP